MPRDTKLFRRPEIIQAVGQGLSDAPSDEQALVLNAWFNRMVWTYHRDKLQVQRQLCFVVDDLSTDAQDCILELAGLIECKREGEASRA